jgi:ATP-dependent Clp protease ATP-binding subunit ClpA
LFARGAYIIITTNAAEEQILQNPNDPNLRELVDAELRKMFRPSFLNRMDKVSIFKPFTDAEYRQLAQIMITKKIGNVQNLFDWTMTVDSASIDYAGLWGRSARYGARPMERLIDSMVTAGVAEWQLAHGPLFAGAQVEIQKLAAQHDFQCRSDQKDVTYTVTPEVNGGSFTKMTSSRMAESSAYRALYTKILHHLQSQPVFTDRD